MKKLLIMMGIILTGVTLTACEDSTTDKVPPVFTRITIEGTTPLDGASLKTYYEPKKALVDVKVELSNVSNFPITAIVINGIHYGSSRFTEDSTNSVIYFQMDVGSSLGETIYSVDEINYLESSNSKTVFVDNVDNNEFKIYVYKDLPTVERENYSLTRNSISIDFKVDDFDSVIQSGTLVAELYSGETKVAEEALAVGQSNIEFTDLFANKQYDVKVVADYDLDDSNGVISNVVLYAGPFLTLANALPSATINNFKVSSNSISFDLEYIDVDTVTALSGLKVAIYQGDDLIRETLVSGSVTDISFDDLLNDTEYTLRVISDYDLLDGRGVVTGNVLSEYGFTTLPRIVPEPVINNLSIEENRILFNLAIDDPTGIIDDTTLVAKLYVNDELVKEASVLNYAVNFELFDIFSNYGFTIEIEASYDLNDGVGVQTNQVILSEDFTTLSNVAPSVDVKDIIVTQGYVTIDLRVFDNNQTLKSSLKAILYENDVAVKTIHFSAEDETVVLGYLVKNSEVYSVEIVADYNLRDGEGTVEDFQLYRSILLSLEAKAPAAELLNIVATNDSIILDINYMDIDETSDLSNIKIYLYLDGVQIDVKSLDIGMNTAVFLGLLSNNQYEIVVTADYNLDDGSGMQYDQVLISTTVLTLEKTVPTSYVTNEGSTTESIIFDIEIIDEDTVIDQAALKAILYLNGVATGDDLALTVGENFFVTFDGLLSNTQYKVVIVTNYDLEDGNGVISDYVLGEIILDTQVKQEPRANIEYIDSDKNDIWFDVFVNDDDSVITGNLKAVLYKDGVATSAEVPLVEGLNTNVRFDGVYSDTRYNVTIVADYYLNDNTPEVLEEVLDYSFVNTIEKELVSAEIYSAVLGTTSMTLDIIVIDPDDTAADNLKAVLYKDGFLTGDNVDLVVGDNQGVTFTGLLSDSVYEAKVVVDYDLNTDEGITPNFTLDSYMDRTEYLGVPTAKIYNGDPTKDSVSVDIIVSDSDSTIVSGTTIAVLYKDGVQIGDTIPLSLGLNENITFSGLLSNNEYVVKVLTDYDLNDVNGVQTDEILETYTITTNAYLLPSTIVSGLTITEDTVYFDFSYDDFDDVLVANTVKASLWIDETKIAEKLVFTEDISFDISNMVTDFDFVIKVTGDCDLLDGEGINNHEFLTLELSTLAYTVPTANITDVTVNQNDVELDVTINDDDNIITQNLKAILYDKDNLILEEISLSVGDNTVAFGQLLNYSEAYSIVIVADYNLMDGEGEHTGAILQEYLITIVNQLVPQADLSNIILTTTSITFDVNVYDRDNTYVNNLKAILYKEGVSVDEVGLGMGANLAISFTGLDSNSDYTVVIVVDYDNNDGNETKYSQSIGYITETTVAKVAVSATIANETKGYDSITFDVNVVDDDSTITGNLKAVLYKDGVATSSEIALSVGANLAQSFTGLVSDMDYTIQIITDYDLNDNTDTVSAEILATISLTTVAKTAPTATISNETKDSDSITFDVNVVDDDSVIETGTLKACLYKDGIATGDEIALSVGTNNAQSFTSLSSNASYSVKIITDYDLDNDAGIVSERTLTSINQTTEEKAIPEAEISNITTYNTKITFDVAIIDDKSAITGNTKAVLYQDDVATGAEVPLSVGNNTSLEFTDLDFGIDYVIRIVTDYDLNEGAGTVSAYEMATDVGSTYQIIVVNEDTIDIQKKKVIFELSTDDIFNILTSDQIGVQLYDKDDNPVGDTMTITAGTEVVLLQLHSDADYYVEFSPTYDVGAGNVTSVVYRYDFHTLPLNLEFLTIDKNTVVMTENATNGTIDFDVIYDADEDSVLQGTVKAYLYINGDGTTVIQEITINSGTNSYQFSGLTYPNPSYQVLIKADADINDGNGTTSLYTFDEVNVVLDDNTAPTFDAIADQTIDEDAYVDIDWTTYIANELDNRTGTLTKVEVEDNVVYDTPGTYTVTVKLVDTAGNETSQEFNVTVSDIIPTATISNVVADNTTITFDVTLTDADSTITGNRKAVLYKAGVVVDEIALITGDNIDNTFSGLAFGTEYVIKVEVDYDSSDGNGVQTGAILDSETKSTASLIIISDIVNGEETYGFTLDIDDQFSILSGFTVAVGVYDENDQLVGDVSFISEPTTFNLLNLYADYDYYIKVTADYDLSDGNGVVNDTVFIYDFHTLAYTAPTATVTNTSTTDTSITFDVTVVDGDSLITGNLKAELYKDGVYVSEIALTVGVNASQSFTGLLSGADYTVKIITDYDSKTKNGTYLLYEMATNDYTTVARAVPTATVTNTSTTDTAITFDVTVVDVDSTITGNLKAVLYKDGVATGSEIALVVGANAGISFTGLLSGTDYTVKIVTDYDVNDGVGTVSGYEMATNDYTTVARVIPAVIVENLDISNATDVIFDISGTNDPDSVIISDFEAVLVVNGVETATLTVTGDGTYTFLGYDGTNGDEYAIIVRATINTNDGNGDVSQYEFFIQSWIYVTKL